MLLEKVLTFEHRCQAGRKLEEHPPLYLSIPLLFSIYIDFFFFFSFRRERKFGSSSERKPSSGAVA